MPYTPPTHSPAASPAQSRSASISLHDRPSSVTAAHQPPRSSSYLKYRRSSQSQASPPAIRPQSEHSSSSSPSHPRSSSLHQSPSPVNNGSYIPTGAIVSPPDSTQNSSDDEEMEQRMGRQIDNLDELKEAIKVLPQRRTPSPDSGRSSEGQMSGRRHGHARATSDSSFLKNFSNKSNAESDVEDEGYRIAPPMVRKKSGELVKSSLKTPNRSRPSSVPSTPTFPKAVHFDQHLEHVRHFMHTEKPTAVSAGSSPIESFDGDDEFPFDSETGYMSPPFEWEIGLPNFPKDPTARKHLPVRVERVYLSTDKQSLLGCVAVQNLHFQKLVVVRFTLDYWQTVSEVTAEYSNDVRKKQREENYDRFTFKVKLNDLANLDTKTLFFCVRYVVAGQELWDNNNHMNFQVDFKKKFLPQNGKPGGVRMPLPRSRPSVSTSPRSMSNLDSFDDLSSITTQVDKPVPRQSVRMGEDNEPVRRANPSGNVFSTRYDFTASLTAAISAANTIMGPRSGLSEKSDPASSKPEDSPYFKFSAPAPVPAPSNAAPKRMPEAPSVPVTRKLSAPTFEAKSATPLQSPSNTEILLGGEKPSIESLSYRELLETYCFFGSARNSPQLTQTQILEENTSHDAYTHNHPILSAYTLGGATPGSNSPSPPTSLTGSPLLDIAQSPRYTPPNGSPPSLTGSQRSSATSSPVPFNTYKYQPRRNHGGFAFDAPTHATAIRS